MQMLAKYSPSGAQTLCSVEADDRTRVSCHGALSTPPGIQWGSLWQPRHCLSASCRAEAEGWLAVYRSRRHAATGGAAQAPCIASGGNGDDGIADCGPEALDGISDGIAFTNRTEAPSIRDFSNKVCVDSPGRPHDSRQLPDRIFGIADGIDDA